MLVIRLTEAHSTGERVSLQQTAELLEVKDLPRGSTSGRLAPLGFQL